MRPILNSIVQEEMRGTVVSMPFREASFMPKKPDDKLSDFGKSMRELAEMLEQDYDFGVIDQVFIENHIHIIQVVYKAWQKRKTSTRK